MSTQPEHHGPMVIQLKKRPAPIPTPAEDRAPVSAPIPSTVPTPQPEVPEPVEQDVQMGEPEQEARPEPVVPRPRPRAKRAFPTGLVLAMIGAVVTASVVLGGGWYVFSTGSLSGAAGKMNRDTTNADVPLTESQIIEKVGTHMLLPNDEMPTIATVTDSNRLKDQLFFKNAQTGDIVLVYMKASRAILYSPSEDKVIEVAPVTMGDQQGTQ